MYLSTLNKLRVTSSRNSKIKILKKAANDPVLQDILSYTYHPLWHYYVTKVDAVGRGTETLANAPWQTLLTMLRKREPLGRSARNAITDFITKLTKQDAELFKKILNKNLRVGISVKTINASNCGVQIPVFGAMLAKNYTGNWTGTKYMSVKWDGVRAVLKNGSLYSRNGHEFIGMQHIIDQAQQLEQFSLDGELLIPNMSFQVSSGLIRSHKDTPQVVYRVFDLPEYDLPFTDRYQLMKQNLPSDASNSIQLVKHVLTSCEDTVKQAFNKVLDKGFEGLMLKDPMHFYEAKRSASWLKLKAVGTVDLQTVGVFEGQGKYENSLGGIIVKTDDGVEVRVGGGFSDTVRKTIWLDPKQFIGLTAEIKYHEFTPSGSLRHPRFVCFRSDK